MYWKVVKVVFSNMNELYSHLHSIHDDVARYVSLTLSKFIPHLSVTRSCFSVVLQSSRPPLTSSYKMRRMAASAPRSWGRWWGCWARTPHQRSCRRWLTRWMKTVNQNTARWATVQETKRPVDWLLTSSSPRTSWQVHHCAIVLWDECSLKPLNLMSNDSQGLHTQQDVSGWIKGKCISDDAQVILNFLLDVMMEHKAKIASWISLIKQWCCGNMGIFLSLRQCRGNFRVQTVFLATQITPICFWILNICWLHLDFVPMLCSKICLWVCSGSSKVFWIL